jgi:transposase-like protein
MRKTYDKAFKAKIALKAVRSEKTVQEIAIAYNVHPNMVSQWKTLLLENVASIFEKSGKETSAETEAGRKQDELYLQVGKLQIKNDFLKKVSATIRERAGAVEPENRELTLTEQRGPLGISRSAYYYQPREKEDEKELELLKKICAVLKEIPFYGYRKVFWELVSMGAEVTENRCGRS